VDSFLLIVASQEPLIRQQLTNAKTFLNANFPEIDLSNIVSLDAGQTDSETFSKAISPSLFSINTVVILRNLQDATDNLVDFLDKYLVKKNTSLDNNQIIIFQHSGIRKGTKLLNQIKAAAKFVGEAKAIKTTSQRIVYVKKLFALAKIDIDNQAIGVLVDAFGDDVDELDATCRQFINDFQGNSISSDDINKYFSGRKQIKIFEISEAVATGNMSKALDLYQNGIFTGLEPIAIIAVVAMQLRKVAKVSVMASKKLKPEDLKMTPWQVSSVKPYLSKWNTANLSKAFYKLAHIEEVVKTNSKIDKNYLVEQLIIDICSSAVNNLESF
jgi:DNA polymerase-3 subunit delta